MELNNNQDTEQSGFPLRFVPVETVAAAFGSDFLEEAFCNRFFLDVAHGKQAHCPDCGEALTDDHRIARYYALKKFTCPSCGHRLTAKKGTILENSQVTPRQYILMALFLEKDFKLSEIANHVGLSPEAIRIWKGKLL